MFVWHISIRKKWMTKDASFGKAQYYKHNLYSDPLTLQHWTKKITIWSQNILIVVFAWKIVSNPDSNILLCRSQPRQRQPWYWQWVTAATVCSCLKAEKKGEWSAQLAIIPISHVLLILCQWFCVSDPESHLESQSQIGNPICAFHPWIQIFIPSCISKGGGKALEELFLWVSVRM